MTNRATLAEGLVFVDERSRLFTMAGRTGLVEARHGEAACGFHNIHAVRVVALHAMEAAFEDRMTLGQAEIRMDLEVASETGGGIFSRIDNELSTPAARGDMFAARPMTRFATGGVRHFCPIVMNAGMGTERKGAGD